MKNDPHGPREQWPDQPDERHGLHGRFGRPDRPDRRDRRDRPDRPVRPDPHEHRGDHDDRDEPRPFPPPPPPFPPPPPHRHGPDPRRNGPPDPEREPFGRGDWRGQGRGRGRDHGRGRDRGEGGREDGRHAARRGEARFILLDVLSDGPKHGYEIIKAIEERSGGQYAPSPGTVYPTLQYLEDQGMVQVSEEAQRRIYELTEAGKAELTARADEIRAFWSRFAAQTVAETSRHDVDFLQEALEDLQRTVWRGLREAIEQGDRDTLRQVRQTLEQCRSDIRIIIADAAKAAPPKTSGNAEQANQGNA